MPAAPAAPPAAAAPAAPAPAKSTSAPIMAMPAEIHVTPGGMTTDSGPPPAPPKPGSARERLMNDLRKKSDAEPTPPPAPKKTEPTPEEAAEPEETGAEAEVPPEEAAAAPAEKPSGKAGDKKKVSPWKLVDEFKARAATLEKELQEFKSKSVDPKEKEALSAKLAAAEARLKELDDEMRFVNYSKSQEFQERYQKPYESAWKRAMGELNELTVTDDSGKERPMSAQDLLELVNMPLQQARARALEVFGDFADDVMTHRKEIRRLFEEQSTALEQARKAGTERDEQQRRQMSEFHERTSKEISEIWTKANEEVVKNEKVAPYFKPVEGDDEGNKRLQRGYEMADRAFSQNPLDPRLTPQQREEIVRLHAAVRNRAAAFGRLMLQQERTLKELNDVKAELAKYQGAQPGSAPAQPKPADATPQSARSQIHSALRNLVH